MRPLVDQRAIIADKKQLQKLQVIRFLQDLRTPLKHLLLVIIRQVYILTAKKFKITSISAYPKRCVK